MTMLSQLSHEQARERIEKLRVAINDYRYHYHVLDESTMSEAAADSLKHELSQLEMQYPDLVTPDSPTQRVAGIDQYPWIVAVERQRATRRPLGLGDLVRRSLCPAERLVHSMPVGDRAVRQRQLGIERDRALE